MARKAQAGTVTEGGSQELRELCLPHHIWLQGQVNSRYIGEPMAGIPVNCELAAFCEISKMDLRNHEAKASFWYLRCQYWNT